MVLCMNSMILGGCIPSPKKQTEPITVEKNPNMMYMLVGSYATPDEEGIKVLTLMSKLATPNISAE